MKLFLVVFFTLGLSLFGLCWWGLCTTAGRVAFPEMAGLVPFYAGLLGGVIILLTGLIFAFWRWRRRSAARTVGSGTDSDHP